jgi:peptide/nickel transport system substrate-binding protein
MKQLRWQILIVVLALIAIGVLLLTQRSEQLTPVITNPEVSGPQPVTGGVYTEALIGNPGRLNPVLDFHNAVDRDVNRLLYSSLVNFDGRGLPVADLAESWGISQDGTVYNFSLKSNAVWHDGEPVTSEDVVFTVELLRNENLPIPADIQNFWNNVDVVALDTFLIQFELPEPFSPFLDYVTFGILPEHLLADISPESLVDDSFNLAPIGSGPIGSGPYRFDQWLADDGQITGVTLSAFDEFYNGRAFIDQFVFRYYATADEALNAYLANEVMGISQIPGQILQTALNEPGLNLYTGRLPQLTMVLLNLDNPRVAYLQDIVVRQALMMSINRQRLVDSLLQGQAIVADNPIFPGSWAFYDGVDSLAYSVDEATNLLRNADYTITSEGGSIREKEGIALSFTLLHPDDDKSSFAAQFIQRSWARIGVEVELESVDYETLVNDHLDRGEYDAALVDLSLFRSPDPDPYPFWHQAQINTGQNYSRWDDRSASEYLEQARLTSDLQERSRLYRNFQIRFARELPALMLYYPVYTYAVDAQVEGVSIGPLFDMSDRLSNASSWFLMADEVAPVPNP